MTASDAANKARPRFGDGRKCLFLASEVRSGSTFVGETIAYDLNQAHGYAFWALGKERFAYATDSTTADEILATWRAMHLDTSGFSSSKILCKALSVIHRLGQDCADIREAFFGEGAYWLVVRRRDRVEQAVSLALADKTKLYHHYDDPELAKDKDAELTIPEIDRALKAVALSDIFLQACAASLPRERVLEFCYEDFLADQVGYLKKIYEFCGLPAIERTEFVNGSKLRQTARVSKKMYAEQFRQWLLANYV